MRNWHALISNLEGHLILERRGSADEDEGEELEISRESNLFGLIDTDEDLADILQVNPSDLSDPFLIGKNLRIQIISDTPFPEPEDFFQFSTLIYGEKPYTREALVAEEDFLQSLPPTPEKAEGPFNPFNNLTGNDLDYGKIGNALYAETQGSRDFQEDAYYCISLPVNSSNRTLSEEDLAYIMYTSITALERELENSEKINHGKIGSTLTASLQYNNHLVTANVGDSRTLLITEDPDNKNKRYRIKARTWDHKPDTPRELKRIQAAGDIVTQKDEDVPRLGGSLAMARSIGDTNLIGIEHSPTLTCDDLTQTPEGKKHYYILHCCDGLSDALSDQEIEKFLNAHATTFNNIPQRFMINLINYATQCTYLSCEESGNGRSGAADNITVLLVPENKEANSVKLSFVADGHGGMAVSRYIEQTFPRLVKQTLDQYQKIEFENLSNATSTQTSSATSSPLEEDEDSAQSSSEKSTQHRPPSF
ncbi:MAG: hypothetical protein A3G71_04560 [Gammaproteobacteria bacterium RIFCSPLOWO2_12_FULL_38_14]|nr:MAG: hypothetical protein A3G71_04560 [Gammaproteobacteria bacterium RIFCSPLOWO2_12_FULL_38_14]